METFSIVDKININKLNIKIVEFIHREGYKPYIFANKETLDVLAKPNEQELKFVSAVIGATTSFRSYFVGDKYKNYKMFEDDTLKFGEIELR